MLENALEIGENPKELIIYASLGRAARSWEEAHRIVAALLELEEDETLVLQTGRPIGVVPTSPRSPMVVSAINNTVGRWSDPERFYERAREGKTIWGGLTAGAWQYIGRQGVLQGTYELLRVVAERHFGLQAGEQALGRWFLTAGLGGMGSAQPISARMLGISSITVEIDETKASRALETGGLDELTRDPAEAHRILKRSIDSGSSVAVGLIGNAADAFEWFADNDIVPDIVSDQTAAHDARYGYVPAGYELDKWVELRETDSARVETDARESIARQVEAILRLQAAGAVAFENGNNLRAQALEHLGEGESERVNRIPGFMAGYLRPFFARGIGPFRWVCLSGSEEDQRVVDELAATLFPNRPEVAAWIELARTHIPSQGLPARSCWLGHGERSSLARAVNEKVADGTISAPVLFTRDHLDSAGMTNPRIGTEGMRDDSDGVADWPLLDAMLLSAGGADLVAVHSGGGGYSGWMQSAGVSVIADGTEGAAERLSRALDSDSDSGLGVLRHATAGYEEAVRSAGSGGETGNAPVRLIAAPPDVAGDDD